MTFQEKLKELNDGCLNCKAKMCNLCPVGKQKKVLKEKLGITEPNLWIKFKNFLKKTEA